MKPWLWRLRARVSYWVARQLFGWPWFVKQPQGWHWLEGQFARMAALGDVQAQSFYGHILAFRGVGIGAREEGGGCYAWPPKPATPRPPINWG